jgi:hypothetical protein
VNTTEQQQQQQQQKQQQQQGPYVSTQDGFDLSRACMHATSWPTSLHCTDWLLQP